MIVLSHLCIEHTRFAEVRQRHYDAGSVRQLFQEISVIEVFDFLQEVGLFDRM